MGKAQPVNNKQHYPASRCASHPRKGAETFLFSGLAFSANTGLVGWCEAVLSITRLPVLTSDKPLPLCAQVVKINVEEASQWSFAGARDEADNVELMWYTCPIGRKASMQQSDSYSLGVLLYEVSTINPKP